MTTFIQIHLLTAYPPANLNRDDTGKPKTARFGNVDRLRVSSQALKRAWREAWRSMDGFDDELRHRLGTRTKRLGNEFLRQLSGCKAISDAQANAIARLLASVFGEIETEEGKELFIKQLSFVSPEEITSVGAVIQKIKTDELYRDRMTAAAREVTLDNSDDEEAVPEIKNAKQAKKPKKSKETQRLIKELKQGIYLKRDGALDIAMFGRMLAGDPDFNREAAVQVAHGITTHRAIVEDDYYTAVDDLKTAAEDAGAGFVGEAGFGAPLLYLYICIDRDLLVRNLGGDEDLARRGIAALLRAAATVGPKGKQASFASRAFASYGLVERGTPAPRTLAAAFLKPVTGDDALVGSIQCLRTTRQSFAAAYDYATESAEMDVVAGAGTLADLIALAAR